MADHIFRPSFATKQKPKQKRAQEGSDTCVGKQKRLKASRSGSTARSVGTDLPTKLRQGLQRFFQSVSKKPVASQTSKTESKINKLVEFYATKENGEQMLNMRLRGKYGRDLSSLKMQTAPKYQGKGPPAGAAAALTKNKPSFLFLDSTSTSPNLNAQQQTNMKLQQKQSSKQRDQKQQKGNRPGLNSKFKAFYAEHHISVTGTSFDGASSYTRPDPVTTFDAALSIFPENLGIVQKLQAAGFTAPSPIQVTTPLPHPPSTSYFRIICVLSADPRP
jgi:hypothetical protein